MKTKGLIFRYCFVLTCFVHSCIQNSNPIVKIVDSESYNFGQATVGDTVVHDFLIVNEGNAPLKIEKVQPGCACTITTLPKNNVLPNGKTFMQVKFVSNEQDIGYCDKLIALRTNAAPSIYILHIKGTINPAKVL